MDASRLAVTALGLLAIVGACAWFFTPRRRP